MGSPIQEMLLTAQVCMPYYYHTQIYNYPFLNSVQTLLKNKYLKKHRAAFDSSDFISACIIVQLFRKDVEQKE